MRRLALLDFSFRQSISLLTVGTCYNTALMGRRTCIVALRWRYLCTTALFTFIYPSSFLISRFAFLILSPLVNCLV